MTAHTHTPHLEFEELAEIELLPVLTRVTDCTDEAGKNAGGCFSLAKSVRILGEGGQCIHVRSNFFHFVVDHIVDAAVGFELGHGGV